jgi:WD40 repeat protein
MTAELKTQQFTRHRGPVTSIAGIPGTRRVVTGGYDSAVGLFDLDTQAVDLMGYHRHLVNRIAVNSSGTLAASSSSDYSVALWNLATGQRERVLLGHSDDVDAFVFIDDRIGASVSSDCRILLWDLASGSITRVLEGHDKVVISVAYHDGRLYTCGEDETVRVWDVASGATLQVWGPFETHMDTCALDPHRGRALIGGDDGCLRVLEMETGHTIQVIQAHSAGVKMVAVSPATGDIVSAGYDRRLLIWRATDLTLLSTLAGTASTWERSLTWSPDGGRILAGTFDGTVQEWDVVSGRLIGEVGDRSETNVCINQSSVTQNGEAVTVSDDGYVRMLHINPHRAAWTARAEPASGRVLMNAVTYSRAEDRVICGAHDHRLYTFRRTESGLEYEGSVHLARGPINAIRVAHHSGYEGMRFVACYLGSIVRVGRDGSVLGEFEINESPVKSLRLHPRYALGISVSADGHVASWDLDGRIRERFVGHMDIVNDVDFDPGGERFASVSRDFTLKVFSLSGGRLEHSVALGKRSLKAVCFVAPDLVLVGNYWGEVMRVSLPDEVVMHTQVAGNGISSLTRLGEYVLATSYDGGAYLLRPEDLAVIQVLRGMQQRVGEPPHG